MAERKNNRTSALLVVATLAVAMVALLYIALNPIPSSNSNPDSGGISCPTYGTNFLVIANGQGFNSSIAHGAPQKPWPVICVHRGDTVTITVENTSPFEPHGFAIGQYYEGGVSIPAGRSVTISFVADKTGVFTVFCDIFCSVHPFMIGVLVVR